jgi:hypothetical protein
VVATLVACAAVVTKISGSIGKVVFEVGPYSIIFGPKQFAGSGFVQWLKMLGEGQVMMIIKHWRAHDDAGRLLRLALSWVQYQSGRGTPILDDVHALMPYLEA